LSSFFASRWSSIGVKVMLVLFFLHLWLRSWATGGRWDLNEQIAFGHRLCSGQPFYANGISDLGVPSSPYFPGVGVLSGILEYLVGPDLYIVNRGMLMLAVVVGVIYFKQLLAITKILFPQIPIRFVTVTLCLIWVAQFRVYMGYLIEFKPDTLLLVLASSLFLMMNSYGFNKSTFVLTLFILLICTWVKQTSFLVYVFAFLLVLSIEKISRVYEILVALIYGIVALVSLYFMFKIENLKYFTVDIMKEHPFFSVSEIVEIYRTALSDNFILVLMMGWAIIRCRVWFLPLLEQLKTNRRTLNYFCFASIWLAFSMLSSFKNGGNSGNVEVGMIAFCPLLVMVCYGILHDLEKVIKNPRAVKNLLMGTMILFLLMSFLRVYLSGKAFYLARQQHINAVDFLKESFVNGGKVFVDGETYLVASSAGLEVVSEAETIGHLMAAQSFDVSHIMKAIHDCYYDVLFISSNQPEMIQHAILDSYQPFISQNCPEFLKEKLWVPKTKFNRLVQ
jgi:hypothetical protein